MVDLPVLPVCLDYVPIWFRVFSSFFVILRSLSVVSLENVYDVWPVGPGLGAGKSVSNPYWTFNNKSTLINPAPLVPRMHLHTK